MPSFRQELMLVTRELVAPWRTRERGIDRMRALLEILVRVLIPVRLARRSQKKAPALGAGPFAYVGCVDGC